VSALDALPHLIRPAAGEPAGAFVLFHGRGTSEHDLFPLLDALDPDRRLLGATPRGPLILPPGGAHWYVVREIGYPDRDTFSAAYEAASGWLDALAVEAGLPLERTVIGGFSQGAVMSWALGLGRGRPRPAAIVALSGFVPTVDGFELDLSPPLPPVAIGHGTYDPVISVEWGRQAKALLEGAGAEVLYRESPMPHSVDPSFLAELQPWIAAVGDQASSSASAGATASRAGLPGSSTTRIP
jgi:phospholipase/carboxylesterase